MKNFMNFKEKYILNKKIMNPLILLLPLFILTGVVIIFKPILFHLKHEKSRFIMIKSH